MFFVAERRHGAVRPGIHVRPVVSRVDHNRIVGDIELVECFEQLANIAIVFDHSITVFIIGHAALATHRSAHMRDRVRTHHIHPNEERPFRLCLSFDEVDRRIGGFIVDRLHALSGQRAGIIDGLLADLSEARIDSRVIPIGSFGF